MREKSSSSSTSLLSRWPSLEMMERPLRTLWGSVISPLSRVWLQPLMAVRGVRSSWETEEMNSSLVFSLTLILVDISLMASTRAPISSSRFFSIWMP